MNSIGITILVFLAVVVIVQLLLRQRMQRLVGSPVPNGAGVDSSSSAGRQLYYFYSPSCGPCRSMSPVIDRLVSAQKPIHKIDASEHPDIAGQFGILGTPSLVLVEDGVVAEVAVGAKSETQIRTMLEPN